MTEATKLAGDKPITAKHVAQAAEKYRPKPPGKTVKKSAPGKAGKPLDFAPVMKLLAKVEKAAGEAKPDQLLKELVALRKVLEALAKTTGKGATV